MPIHISEYLQITDGESRYIQCRKCNTTICTADKNYKRFVIMKEDSIAAANPDNYDSRQYVDHDVVFRRYYCPSCATQLETEVNLKGEEPVWDIRISI